MDLNQQGKPLEIENNVQDRSSDAWIKLCEYVEMVAEEGSEEFAPFKYLGKDLYPLIHTLPSSIAKLKKVKKIVLYGSQLKRIPPEIGEMESLEVFTPYTSYRLNWFPYEIINCKNLIDSTVSTRALFGNYKHRRHFPDLTNNPVYYEKPTINCSICKKEITYLENNQLWISLKIGTDVLPLLVNSCSKECEMSLPRPPEGYIQFPHKGGIDLQQPSAREIIRQNILSKKGLEEITEQEINNNERLGLLGLIRSFWKR